MLVVLDAELDSSSTLLVFVFHWFMIVFRDLPTHSASDLPQPTPRPISASDHVRRTAPSMANSPTRRRSSVNPLAACPVGSCAPPRASRIRSPASRITGDDAEAPDEQEQRSHDRSTSHRRHPAPLASSSTISVPASFCPKSVAHRCVLCDLIRQHQLRLRPRHGSTSVSSSADAPGCPLQSRQSSRAFQG